MIDPVFTSIIGGLCTVVGFMVRSAFSVGQRETGLSITTKTHGERLDEHKQRLDGHDQKFSALPTEFVPRPELERALAPILDSQRESKQLLLHLVTSKPIPPTTGE